MNVIPLFQTRDDTMNLMKRIISALCCLFIICVPCTENVYGQKAEDLAPTAFLGEIPPEHEPKTFSPNLIFSKKVVGFAITPDDREIYFCQFTANEPQLFFTKAVDDRWTRPERTPFNESHFGGPPHISPDGQYIYWRTNRPFPEDWPGMKPQPGTREALQYWTADRSGSDWINARPLQLPVSLDTNLLGLSSTSNGTIYSSIAFHIVRFRKQGGQYTGPERLPNFLNGHSPAVSPDERYIVFVQGTPRKLYVSFRDQNDSWTQPRSLGDNINRSNMNGYPSITSDGRYLFYTVDHTIIWIRTDYLHHLRPTE